MWKGNFYGIQGATSDILLVILWDYFNEKTDIKKRKKIKFMIHWE